MTNLYTIALCASLLLAALPSRSFAQDVDPVLRDRFEEGVSRTARMLEDISFRARCTVKSEYSPISKEFLSARREHGAGAPKPQHEEFECAIRGENVLERPARAGDSSGLEYVMAKNAEYGFRITRAPATGYSLDWLGKHGADPEADQDVKQQVAGVLGIAMGSWHLFGEPLPHLIESPSFKITGVSTVSSEDNGADLVRVEFERLIDDPDRKRLEWLEAGFMVCDPARHWALREYQATFESGAVHHVHIEFGESVDDFPIAGRITSSVPMIDYPGTILRGVRTVEMINSDIVPEEEFYLSHYSLPEPTFRRSWFGPWVWYLIAGIVCLVVSVMILKRRRATG